MQWAAGGKIRIMIKAEATCIRVTVTDDGIGIPSERLKSLLSDKTSGGVGLINIHKRLLMLYGKGLQMESQWKHGTTVRLEIPT